MDLCSKLELKLILIIARMDSTSASCARAARRRAQATGGTEIDTSDPLFSCRPTGFHFENFYLFSLLKTTSYLF